MNAFIPIILMIIVGIAVRNASMKAQKAQKRDGQTPPSAPKGRKAAAYGQRIVMPNPETPGIQPLVDPLPRQGHEECDPTEGSLEIPGRSPEGAFSDEGVSFEEAPMEIPAPVPRVNAPVKQIYPAKKPLFDAKQLRQAVIAGEILGRPVSLRTGRR